MGDQQSTASEPFHVACMIKRLVDVAMSIFLLVVLAPVLIAVAIAIKLDSRGPVLFRQQRIGRLGRPFTILKFRTMVDRADTTLHQQAIERLWSGERLSDDPAAPYKLTADPRITKIGHWLRRTSVDELPQLINVVRGEMSIVGPRPMIPYEVTHLSDWHHERHRVRPGMTGLSQVVGRGRTTMEDMLRLDVEYVRKAGLWTDIKLIFSTVPVVIRGSGAR